MHHFVYIAFLFALGACIGSFLNVVVWRVPRDESLVNPPSRCPKCGNRLKWYDNIPVLGWIKLGGRCRFCKAPISIRYPIVEAFTGGMFVFYFVMFFMVPGFGPHTGRPRDPIPLVAGLPIYGLYILMLCTLLAASLIDAEHYFIPIGMIWWLLAPAGLIVHALIDAPGVPGALNANPLRGAIAAGGGVGLLISFLLWKFNIIPTSFADSQPPLEIEIEQKKRKGDEEDEPQWTRAQFRAEMRKEMLFLLPPMLLAFGAAVLVQTVPSIRSHWESLLTSHHVSGLLGALLGLLVGGFVVWITRILGTLGFGREAMGLGDVHLMAGVGAIVGAAQATIAFFIAPFFGILLAIWMLFFSQKRQLPFGPYLSLGTAAVMLFYRDIANYFAPGVRAVRELMGIPI